jgi:hypothetical protein
MFLIATMNGPMVSFVVPCYKLAHFLPECVNSILAQTYRNLEVLIMNDCSPDNTAEVASSFSDGRVRYIRNERNLGHLRNYNKGIELSQGKYVWLISADDYLRNTNILERYVELMEKHPEVGYTFCPGFGVQNGQETALIGEYGKRDRIVNGRRLLEDLIHGNFVLAASAMARRECYERISRFPLDARWADSPVEMGWVGDWYLWCVFALFFDVGYFAEPMVCYREHDLNMTATITRQETIDSCATADIAVPWLIKQQADIFGMGKASKKCLAAVANEYARQAKSKRYRSGQVCLTANQFEESLCQSTDKEQERNWIRARFADGLGDRFFLQGDLHTASTCYLYAVRKDPRFVKVYAKLVLLPLGRFGNSVRVLGRALRGAASAFVTR